MVALGSDGEAESFVSEDAETESRHTPVMYGGIYRRDDVVGHYLAQQAAQRQILQYNQAAAAQHYVREPAGYFFPGPQFPPAHTPNAYGHLFHQYPDPERIRHIHTLHSLLPYLDPPRRLNALSGPTLDITEHSSEHILCRAVPKKLLVLFLGRTIVSKYIHTMSRITNPSGHGTGAPTQQSLRLPLKTASSAALRILVAWMTRACTYATMSSMKPIQIPTNLFAACSLAQTMELLGLRRDAYRVDVAITQQFAKRPIHLVEVETLWRCLGECNRYVYAAIRAVRVRVRGDGVGKELLGLRERYPGLYARICEAGVNEQFKPELGRAWSDRLPGAFEKKGAEGRACAEDGYETSSASLGDEELAVQPCASTEDGSVQEERSRAHSGAMLDPRAPVFDPIEPGT